MTTVSASFVHDLMKFLRLGPRLYEFEAFIGNPDLIRLALLVAQSVISEKDLRTIRVCDVKRVRGNWQALSLVSQAFKMIAEERLTPEEVHGFMRSPVLRRIARSSRSKGTPTLTELRAFFAKWPAWNLTPMQEEMRGLLGNRFVTPGEAVQYLQIASSFVSQGRSEACPEILDTMPELSDSGFTAPFRTFTGRKGLLFPLLGVRSPHSIFEPFFLKGRSPSIKRTWLANKTLRDLPDASAGWRAGILHPDMIGKTLDEQKVTAKRMRGRVASLEEMLTYLILWHGIHEELPSDRLSLRVADPFVRRGTAHSIAVSILNHRGLQIVELGPNEKSPTIGALVVF